MKKIFLSTMLLALVTTSFAVTCEKIILTNGFVLEGYLSKQYPKESRVVINVEKAVILLNDSIVESITDKYCDLDSLTDEWKAYVDENPEALIKSGNKKKLLLSSVNLQTDPNTECLKQFGPLASVRIIERGSNVKLLCLNKCEYSVQLQYVQSIEPFLSEEKDGLMDVVVTKKGQQFEGHIFSREIGKQIKIKTKDGINQVVSYKDLEAIKRRPLNLEKSVFEQYHYNDIVRKTNGQEYKGLIIQQNLGTELKDNYIMIQTSPYDFTTVFNSEIECLLKEPKEKLKQVKSKEQTKEKSKETAPKEVVKEVQKLDSIPKKDKKELFNTTNSSLHIKICGKNVKMDKLAVSDDRYFFVPDDVEKVVLDLDSIQNRFALSVPKTDTKRYKLIPAMLYQGSTKQQFGFKIKEKDSKKYDAYSENEIHTGEKISIFSVEEGMYILFCESNSSCVLCEVKI